MYDYDMLASRSFDEIPTDMEIDMLLYSEQDEIMANEYKNRCTKLIEGFVEEGKFHDTGDVKYLHRMEMCETLGEAIEALDNTEDEDESI